jgi:hypothetical protein
MCLPILCCAARRYVRSHQDITETSRKKLAMMYHPPSFSGGIDSPCSGPGGSSASQNSCRMNSGIDQLTWLSMLRPTILNHSVPVARLISPAQPR